MELLKQLKSVAPDRIILASCKPEQMAGVDGFRCSAIYFRAHHVLASGISLVDDEDLSDVEVLWVREASAYEIKECEGGVPLTEIFPSHCLAWSQAGAFEVAVLAALSPRRRFWASDKGDFVRHDAGLRLGNSGSQVFITPSQMPFGDLFVSVELPSEIDGSFRVIKGDGGN